VGHKEKVRKALVTGGAGFIGSHLVNRLLKDGWGIIVVDNLSTGFKSNIPEEVEFLHLDLTDDNFVEKLPIKKIDVVFHLAAQSSGEISFDDPKNDLKTNTLGTLMLLNWCRDNDIKRFCYTSSMSIYGDQPHIPINENVLASPKSFYGIGKHASELYMSMYDSVGIASTAYRLFNVYGPGQNMSNLRQGMVSIFLEQLHKKKNLLVKGCLERFRDFIYIDDVINCFMQTLDDPVTYGKSYNVGTGIKTTVRSLIENMIEIYGTDCGNIPIEIVHGTLGDQFGIFADITKINNETGWAPATSLNVGLTKMVSWIKKSDPCQYRK
jgi:UDP-glucose 4-epimerase